MTHQYQNNNEASLPSVQLNTARPMSIFIAPLYRFMPENYVDSFFSSGQIRISCVKQFKKHSDELQGDKSEGQTLVGINDIHTNRSIGTFNTTLSNAYILSLTRKTNDMDNVFGEGIIEIFDPINFCAEIANEIPGCIQLMMGDCIYVDQKVLISDQLAPSLEDLRSDLEPDKIDLGKILQASNNFSGPKEYFLKLKKYAGQMEVRMIWETNKEVNDPLFINIQNPERFCRKL